MLEPLKMENSEEPYIPKIDVIWVQEDESELH